MWLAHLLVNRSSQDSQVLLIGSQEKSVFQLHICYFCNGYCICVFTRHHYCKNLKIVIFGAYCQRHCINTVTVLCLWKVDKYKKNNTDVLTMFFPQGFRFLPLTKMHLSKHLSALLFLYPWHVLFWWTCFAHSLPLVCPALIHFSPPQHHIQLAFCEGGMHLRKISNALCGLCKNSNIGSAVCGILLK